MLNLKILLNTGEEVIQGSTRLKAGTSQKICLNLISTMVMIKLNKVKKGRMIYVVPTNKKLRKRKNNIDLFFKTIYRKRNESFANWIGWFYRHACCDKVVKIRF